MAGGPTRQDTHRITVQIEDPSNPGTMVDFQVWDKMTGGDVDSDDNKYYPGGMVPPISIGGRRTVANVTVSRLYMLERDHARMPMLIAAAGRSAVQLSRQPLQIDGKGDYKPIVYNGKLKRVVPPDLDS